MHASSWNSDRGDARVELLWGAAAVHGALEKVAELAVRSGQPEAIDDIRYYLEKPGLLKRHPVLALLYENPRWQRPDEPAPSPDGAVLLFRYRIAGLPTGCYTSNDRSGRRTVIAQPEKRLQFAQTVIHTLEQRRASVVMLSLRCDPLDVVTGGVLAGKTASGSQMLRHRDTPDYLPLEPTFDATLARIGKRTRTHMRYYRKRAEEQLGCAFDAHLQIDAVALLDLNRKCTHPLRDNIALWRFRALSSFSKPILVGLRDREGELLAIIGGRQLGDEAEIFWQMNQGDRRGHSLSLAIRSYLIQELIARGVRRLYFDGGSAHSLSNSFVRSTVTDVVMLRRSVLTYVLRRSAKSLIPWDNELAHLLVVENADEAPGLGNQQGFLSAVEQGEDALPQVAI